MKQRLINSRLNRMEIKVDRNIYSDACISKAIYALSDRYCIARSLDGTNEILYVRGIDESKEEKVKKDLLTTLNDYKLRQIIEDETHEILTILYAKAFADFEDIELEDV